MKKSAMIAFLVALGFTKANAEKLAANNTDEGTSMEQKDIDALVLNYKDNQKELLKNDSEFISTIEAAEKGKNFDIITRELKSIFGLDAAELKDDKGNKRELKDVIKVAKDKLTKGLDKTTGDLQNELLQLNAKIKDYEDNVIPNTKKEVEEHKKNFNITNKLRDLVSKNKLTVPFEPVFTSLNAAIADGYKIDVDDKGELILFNKIDNTKATNKDKTGFLSVSDFINGKLTDWNFIEKSNAGKGTTTTTTIVQPDGKIDPNKKPTHYSPHMESALKHIETLKEKPVEK